MKAVFWSGLIEQIHALPRSGLSLAWVDLTVFANSMVEWGCDRNRIVAQPHFVMRADTLTLKALFQKDVRYVIPTFQRPYVWNQDDQWEPFWNDVRNTAERYLDELARNQQNRARAEEKTGTHFMGAVVLQQQLTAAADVETRSVIDGQQRLTTAQILIDATQEVFETGGAEAAARRMSRMVLNDFAEADERFKLWPTGLDREPFRAAMKNGAPTDMYRESLIVKAHDFFSLQVREWVQAALTEKDKTDRVQALEAAILGLIEMVVIDLASTDEPSVIFETLNARGTPLLASDLVKNFVMYTAQNTGVDAEELHRQQWMGFETSWWRKEIRQGRIVRPRLDVFLNYWLVMETAKEVKSHEVFPQFRRYVESEENTVVDIVGKLRCVGETYQGFEEFPPTSRTGTFFYRWRTVDAGTTTPLLLWLFSQPEGALSEEHRLQAIAGIESYLVRRMICRMTTKDYNRLFLELMSRLHRATPRGALDALVQFLSEQTSESRRWPTDSDVEQAVFDLPLYRLLTRARLRMVLEAIEEHLRSHYAEEPYVTRGPLTIEHVMPRGWREKDWPLPESPDFVQAARERERLLHSLGNLTLVTGRLNPKLSNAPWTEKRRILDKHTVLRLNRDLLIGFQQTEWGEATIRERGAGLAEAVKEIWPLPPTQGGLPTP